MTILFKILQLTDLTGLNTVDIINLLRLAGFFSENFLNLIINHF